VDKAAILKDVEFFLKSSVMDISSSSSNNYTGGSAISNAVSGLQEQNQRFEKNVVEVASSSSSASRDNSSQDRALIEQQEIVNNFRGNARALEASNEAVGSIIDIEV